MEERIKMKKRYNLSIIDILVILQIILLIIITVIGVSSFSSTSGYDFTNQYGDIVKIFGSGIYQYDSFFKAPIFIGSDFTMLIIVVPLFVFTYFRYRKHGNLKNILFLTSIVGTILYYATSIVFGVTYNILHLVYISLFSISLFLFIKLLLDLDLKSLQESLIIDLPTRGISVFLVITGLALNIAWLPDILSAILSGNSLSLIEVYTTEITYVLDIGIISPLAFISLYLLRNKNGLGVVILSVLLMTCAIIGIVLPMQTVFQTLAGIDIPLGQLIIKVIIFIVLAMFAFYFLNKLFNSIDLENK